jgi:glycosyltransferase involved in cell wall biosynthesis
VIHQPEQGEHARALNTQPPPGDWPAPCSVAVSVLVPVKNEERNLAACLRRLVWANEIVVVDSRSTDATGAIAQAFGAQVHQFDYSKEGWPKKKNWALEHVPWKNEWVLIMDADEHMTPELAREIEEVVAGRWHGQGSGSSSSNNGFWINRKFMFMGRWIKGCGYYPSWNLRLFKHTLGRYERIGNLGDTGSGDNEVHEHVKVSSGRCGHLKHEFLHYAYPDLSTWIEKHNRYSTWEAHAALAGDAGEIKPNLFGSAIERRRWVKRISRKLPGRPGLRFVYSYLLKRGFLDGYPGLVMSSLLAWYELVSVAKQQEIQTIAKSGPSTPD